VQVCAWLRPTAMPHAELLSLEGICRFVAEYLILEPLGGGGADPPECMTSPVSTLAWQVTLCWPACYPA
jgi:hypothetical protein